VPTADGFIQMIKIIPISNLLLALSVLYLKIIYGQIHSFLVKLYSIEDINNDLKQTLGIINHQLNLLIIFLATMSIVVAVVSIQNKLCNRIIGIFLLLISFLSLVFSLVSI